MEYYRRVVKSDPNFIIFTVEYSILTKAELDFVQQQQTVKWAAIIGKVPYKSAAFTAMSGKSRIRFIWSATTTKINRTVLNELLKVAFWMLQASHMRSARIFYWDVLTKRILPPSGEAIEPIHVNGGSSFKDDTSAICIYRREESPKVLIHEFIHALGLDITVPPPDTARLFEAYTEAIAEWLYIIYIGKPVWNKQIAYARDRANKLIKHFNGGQWKETTAAFAYYIMKYVLLTHINDVVASPTGCVELWPTWLAEFLASRAGSAESRSTSLAMLAPRIAPF